MEQTNYNRLLINEPPLQVLPSLAVALKSVDKAIMLQQLHYWTLIKGHERDGKLWIYNTAKNWQKQFPWLGESTVRKYLKQLEDQELIITGNYNKFKFDRTKWYTLNYQRLEEIQTITPMCSAVAHGYDTAKQTYTIDYPETNINNHFSKMIANSLLNKLNLLSYKDDKQILDTANVVIKFKDQLRDELLVYGIERVRQNQVHNSNIKNNVAGYLTSVYKHWIEAGITEVAEAKAESEARYREDVDKEVYRDMYEAGYTDIADYKEAYGG